MSGFRQRFPPRSRPRDSRLCRVRAVLLAAPLPGEDFRVSIPLPHVRVWRAGPTVLAGSRTSLLWIATLCGATQLNKSCDHRILVADLRMQHRPLDSSQAERNFDLVPGAGIEPAWLV